MHGPNWLKWTGHLKGQKDIVGIELGTFQGDSAQWFLDNIFTDPTAIYHCVDTFEGSVEHHIAGIDCRSNLDITREKLKDAIAEKRCFINIGYSADQLVDIRCLGFSADFVYVDAAHDALNVLRDAVLSFELLKVGGVMVFDDYLWHVMPRDVDCPKMAIDAFVSCYADQIEVLGKGSQLALRRK